MRESSAPNLGTRRGRVLERHLDMRHEHDVVRGGTPDSVRLERKWVSSGVAASGLYP